MYLTYDGLALQHVGRTLLGLDEHVDWEFNRLLPFSIWHGSAVFPVYKYFFNVQNYNK